MKNTLETRLGLFFALAMIAAIIIMELAGDTSYFRAGRTARARFNNIQELKVGDPVKMAGVQLGRVDDIRLADGKVEVVMKLDSKKATEVKTDSHATVKFIGLLGQNYVALGFGSPASPAITDNSLLESEEQTDLSTLMVKLDGVATGLQGITKNLGGDNFNNLLGPFTDFLKENNPKLTAILGNMQSISAQIAKGEGTVGKLINDDALYTSALTTVTNLNATVTDVQAAVKDARTLVSQVQAGQGTLGKLTTDEALYKEMATAATNLKEILEKINRGQGSVGKIVNDEGLYRNAKVTLQKLNKATDGLEDQGPLTVLGIAIGSLF